MTTTATPRRGVGAHASPPRRVSLEGAGLLAPVLEPQPHGSTAEDAADALYAQGLLSPEPSEPAPRDIAVPLQAVPEPEEAVAERKARAGGLQAPPDTRHPAWALSVEPPRDAGYGALFPERAVQVTAFWAWLLSTRSQAAGRAAKGYAYISTNARATGEDTALYGHLALWLLTQWYEPQGAAPRPLGLTMPFPGFEQAKRRPYRVVRALAGLGDELLLEEALEVWRADSLQTGYLVDVGLLIEPDVPFVFGVVT